MAALSLMFSEVPRGRTHRRLEESLAQLDRAFALGRLDESAMIEAERLSSFVRFQLWRLEHTISASLRSG